MEIPEALEKLKQYLDELENLRKLNYKNNKQWLWKNKVSVVLEAAFGKNSDEYKLINPRRSISYPGIQGEEQKDYLEKLKWWETQVTKILQKYEIVEVNRKSSSNEELPETPKGNKVWQWIDKHRILSILFALAAIATIISVIYSIFFS